VGGVSRARRRSRGGALGFFGDQWSEAGDDDEGPVDPALAAARRRLLADTLRPHRGRLALAAASVVVSTAGVLAMPWLVKRAIDDGIGPGDRRALAAALVGFLVAATADFAGQRLALRLVGRVAEDAVFELRNRLWRHVCGLSVDFFERQRAGRVISRVTTDVEAVYELFSQAALTVVSNLLVMSGIAVALVLLDPLLAAVTLLTVPVLLAATQVFKVRSEHAYRRVREKIALVLVHLAESLTGIRVVQAYTREPLNLAAFEDVNRQHREASSQTVLLMSVYGPGVELLGQLAVVLVLLVGGLRALEGAMTVGVLTAFVLYLRQFFDPLQELSQFFNSLQAANAGLEKIAGVLGTTSTVPERPGARPLSRPRGEVRLERVTFAYRDTPVLHDVDLAIAPGETLALVGPTGAGKSTIAKLIARFYDPTTGRVLLDGTDLRDLEVASLRRAVAIVPQEPFLFAGSVHDNIALGRPDATRADVEAAARAVGAHDVIAALPDGYDTDVTKRGARLSGGQRQLVSFARAWLADPAVLILDEATSALDLPTERVIQRAIKGLLAGRTAVVIAHRLSSIEVADRVAVIEDGRIVELGSRAELLARESRFRALHDHWRATLAT
jgi:ATP-binding cassette subfamily B protein